MRNSVEISMKVGGNLKPKTYVQNFTNGRKVSNWRKIVKAKFCCHSAVPNEKLKNLHLKQQFSRLTHLDVHHAEKNCLSVHIWKIVREFFISK